MGTPGLPVKRTALEPLLHGLLPWTTRDARGRVSLVKGTVDVAEVAGIVAQPPHNQVEIVVQLPSNPIAILWIDHGLLPGMTQDTRGLGKTTADVVGIVPQPPHHQVEIVVQPPPNLIVILWIDHGLIPRMTRDTRGLVKRTADVAGIVPQPPHLQVEIVVQPPPNLMVILWIDHGPIPRMTRDTRGLAKRTADVAGIVAQPPHNQVGIDHGLLPRMTRDTRGLVKRTADIAGIVAQPIEVVMIPWIDHGRTTQDTRALVHKRVSQTHRVPGVDVVGVAGIVVQLPPNRIEVIVLLGIDHGLHLNLPQSVLVPLGRLHLSRAIGGVELTRQGRYRGGTGRIRRGV